MDSPTTRITVTELLKLVDDVGTARRIATALRVELEEILENKLALVSDLEMFENARAVLDEARKAGL